MVLLKGGRQDGSTFKSRLIGRAPPGIHARLLGLQDGWPEVDQGRLPETVAVQVLGHASCPKVHSNPSKVIGAVVSMAQAQVTAYARGVALIDDCSGVHSTLLVTLLGNAAAVQSNERLQRRQHKSASTAHNNQPNVGLYIGQVLFPRTLAAV